MNKKKNKGKVISIVVSAVMAVSLGLSFPIITNQITDSNGSAFAAKKKPTYTISAKSKPCYKKWAKYSTYNKKSKHWYLFTSYMKKFSKTGGGTLIVKKGTYNLPISVQVPSNVTIKFNNGVVIKKTAKTGTKKLHKNGPLFQLVSPAKYKKANAVGNYNGTKNVKFIGAGNVTFRMNKKAGDCAIIMAQNQNVTVQGITFTNGGGHYFELDASKNVLIQSCKFLNITNTGKTVEAINLDTPDSATGGFSFKWSKKDKKPNIGVTIRNCTFSNMNRAIGTHKYSQVNGVNMMHTNVTIENNRFTNVKGYEGAVVPYNWKNVTIRNNFFSGTGRNEKTYGIVAHSVVSPRISGNTFSKYQNTILIRRGFTSSGYRAPAAISVSKEEKALLSENYYYANTITTGMAQITENPYYTSNLMEYYQMRIK